MKIYNVKEAGRGTGTSGEWVRITFQDEKGQVYSSFNEVLLDIQDGTDVDGKTTIVEKNGKQYYNFQMTKNNSQLKAEKPYPLKKQEEKPDWSKIAEGKVKHGLVVAMIGAKWKFEDVQTNLGKYVDLVMGRTQDKEPQDNGEQIDSDFLMDAGDL